MKSLQTVILYNHDSDDIVIQYTATSLSELKEMIPDYLLPYLSDAVYYGSEKVFIDQEKHYMCYSCWSITL